MRGVVIGGVSSGSGKTTFSMGLMHLLKRKKYKISAFKAGPDYIDPMYHRYVLGCESYNLPVWMIDDESIKYLFAKRSKEKDFSIIEGVMGYFDGHSPMNSIGSTANLSSIINVPSIIIMDAGKMSLTAASILKGLETFEDVNMIKGVVFNRVQSDSHYEILKAAVEKHTSLKCYGRIPYDGKLGIESRHLGLLQASEIEDLKEKLDKIADIIDQHVDWEGIINDFYFEPRLSNISNEIDMRIKQLEKKVKAMEGLTIGIAKDLAFSFYYDENLKTLKEIGVKIKEFSPLNSKELPSGIDAVYLGGGYPEEFAEALSQNNSFLSDFLAKMKAGLPVYAECGGLMYLGKSITNLQKQTYEMVGFFNADSIMTERLQRFGHVTSKLKSDRFDVVYRAHEFHKSVFKPREEIKTLIHVEKRNKSWVCGYSKENVIATYSHNHFYSNLDFLEQLISFWSNKKCNICT